MASQSLTPRRRPAHDLTRGLYPFAYLRRQFDRIFDDPFRAIQWPTEASLFPHIDISRTDREISLRAELPGFHADDIEIHVTSESITLIGEKTTTRQSRPHGHHWSRRTHDRFQRTIPLPDEVHRDQAQVHFSNDLLTITIPKRHPTRPRPYRLEIRL